MAKNTLPSHCPSSHKSRRTKKRAARVRLEVAVLEGRIVPSYFPSTASGIHVFEDQLPGGMSSAMVQFLATHTDGTQKQTLSEIDTLRAINPNYTLLHYQLGTGNSPYDYIINNQWSSDWSYVNQQESWFAHQSYSAEPQSAADLGSGRMGNSTGWDQADIANPAWQNYMLSQVFQNMAATGSNGWFADSFTYGIGGAGYDGTIPTRYQGTNAANPPDWPGGVDWTTQLGNWAQTAETAFAQHNAAYGTDYQFIPNLDARVTSWEPNWYLNSSGIPIVDGAFLEGFGEYTDTYDWALSMNRGLNLTDNGKIVIMQPYLQDTPDSTTGQQERNFYLGTYLLLKGNETYLNMFYGGGAQYYPEYQLNLGTATTPLPTSVSSYLWNGVYRRDFQNGFVLVNPGSTTYTLNLGGTYQLVQGHGGGTLTDAQIDASGNYIGGSLTYQSMSSITLAGGTAAIFLTNSTQSISDPGFETPALAAGGIQYNPFSSPWTFHGSAGVSANGSAFTAANPSAPQGSQVAFLQGGGSVSQSIVFPAGTYDVSFFAAQRGNLQSGGQTFQVLMDGTVIASFNNLGGTGYTSLVTTSFTVTAGSHVLLFQGTDLRGGDNTVFLDQVAINQLAAGLNDSGFENVVVGNGGFQYTPAGSPWTFHGSAGVAGNGSAFTAGNPNAPAGSQVAFIQAGAGISQSVVFPAGTYDIMFSAAQRANLQAGGQTFQVLIDGKVVGTFNNLAGANYTVLTTSSFTVTAGNHTLLFQGTDLHGGDNTVFLDQVVVNLLPTNLNDSGWENPAVGNGAFQYDPAGSAWTFAGSTGLAGNGSAFTVGNPNAPQGSQVAFIQGGGSISQSVVFAAGNYDIGFFASQRGNQQAGGQTFEILIDGNVIGTFNNPVGTSYTNWVTGSFTVTAGSHTLTLLGTDLHGGDNTIFLDQIAINPLP